MTCANVSAKTMRIVLTSLSGAALDLELGSDSRVADVKSEVWRLRQVPTVFQMLLCDSVVCSN
jgi:hypothetical protein